MAQTFDCGLVFHLDKKHVFFMRFRTRPRSIRTRKKYFEANRLFENNSSEEKTIINKITFLQVKKTCQKCHFWTAEAGPAVFLGIFSRAVFLGFRERYPGYRCVV